MAKQDAHHSVARLDSTMTQRVERQPPLVPIWTIDPQTRQLNCAWRAAQDALR